MTNLLFLFLHPRVRSLKTLNAPPPATPPTRLEAYVERTTLSCPELVLTEIYHNQRLQLQTPYDNPDQAEIPVSSRVCECVH